VTLFQPVVLPNHGIFPVATPPPGIRGSVDGSEVFITGPDMNRMNISMIALPLGLFGVMLLSAALGRRIAAWRSTRRDDASAVGTSAVDAAVLGLLGLLMAFWFSSAGTRLDMRRTLIVEEANAIGTAWLRLDLLPEDTRSAVREEVRSYLDVRLAQTPGAAHAESDADLANRLATAQDSIWRQSVAAAPRCLSPQAAVLLLDALNAMFDAGTRHRAAFNAHTPVAILALLLLVAIFAAVLAGHDMAGRGRFNWLHIIVFAGVVSLTIWVIYDLEMPRYGLIRIDDYDQTLLDLRDSFRRGP
jgi:hypothetical protein